MNRIHWVDNAKAIAIFLVIFGHFGGLNPLLRSFIYSFHIPIFLFMTGFLLSSSINTLSVCKFLKKKIFPYIGVYLFFSIMSMVLWYFLKHFGDDVFSILQESTVGMLYGVHGAERLFMHGNGPLWYFPYLIVTLIALYVLTRLPVWLGWVLALIYCAFSLSYSGVRLPWCLDIAGIGALFAFMGHHLRIHYDGLQCVFQSRLSLKLLPAILVLLVVLVGINGEMNINRAIFGGNITLCVVNAVIGCLCLLIISYNIPATKLAQNISIHTMTIFCTHIYLVKVFRVFPYPDNGAMKFILIILFSIMVLITCLFFAIKFEPLLKRYLLRK
ncbi:MAG: hypothetical protein COA45_04300 [Zetaproteobacteria bacterium]|nr:MAG: hypothetical protein COA45_04300 [Zetaproteobacteria bacterium]